MKLLAVLFCVKTLKKIILTIHELTNIYVYIYSAIMLPLVFIPNSSKRFCFTIYILEKKVIWVFYEITKHASFSNKANTKQHMSTKIRLKLYGHLLPNQIEAQKHESNSMQKAWLPNN
jgi:hypothetical protein